MASLRLVNLQAPIATPFWGRLAAELAARTGLPVVLDDAGSWTERQARFFAGEAELAVLCGLPYARHADGPAPRAELLAAPVMAHPRYAGEPVYFSDVLVRAESPYTCFADLRGATWAYNEPASHSGYWLVRRELARRGAPANFLGRVVESGAHEVSIAMLLDGRVDASAIDSTVWEAVLAGTPALAGRLRTLETWGPSPIPPLLVSSAVPVAVRDQLRLALLGCHEDPAGRALLESGQLARFVAVTDATYDPIRCMAEEAEAYAL